MGTPTQIFIPFFSRATNHHIHPPFLQEWISYLFTWFESNSEPIPVEHSLKLRFSPQFHHRCYSDVRHPGLSVECFFPQFQRCPGSSCSSSNGRVRSGVSHCGLHSDGEKKNGQGVNLREEERNPWNLSQEVFDKKKTVVMSFHFIGNSTNNFLFPCLIISVSIIYIKILSTETWHRVYDLNIPFLWRWSSVQYFESDFEECLTGQGLMERETNAFKSCPPEERLNRL